MRGLVADIQRGSYHDGPGIRTTVFLKGCNLRCRWCHNPETISTQPEYLLNPEKCIGCNMCAEGCYSGARVLCGTEMTVEQVMAEVLDDKPFYGDNGGLTVSGGEPLMQPEFTRALLQAARDNGISAGVESNLCFSENIVAHAFEPADIIMADIKLFNEHKHRANTAGGNAQVFKNLKMLSHTQRPIIIRTPVIPGVNFDIGELSDIAGFVRQLGDAVMYYELLPYHPLGTSKGACEGFTAEVFERPEMRAVEEMAKTISQRHNIKIKVAGKTV